MSIVLNKRSKELVDGSVKSPTPENLNFGEIAINYKKGNETLFIKNDENEVVPLKIGKSSSHTTTIQKNETVHIFKGPGRPDKPETTEGALDNVTVQNGDMFVSSDGAGSGAWVWTYLGGKWIVTNGDTGWYELSPLSKDARNSNTPRLNFGDNRILGKIRYRRINNQVYCALGGNEYGSFKIANLHDLWGQIKLPTSGDKNNKTTPNLGPCFEPITDVSVPIFTDMSNMREYVEDKGGNTNIVDLNNLGLNKEFTLNDNDENTLQRTIVSQDILIRPFHFDGELYDKMVIKSVTFNFQDINFKNLNNGEYRLNVTNVNIEGSKTVNLNYRFLCNITKSGKNVRMDNFRFILDNVTYNRDNYTSMYGNVIIGNFIAFSRNGSANDNEVGQLLIRLIGNKIQSDGVLMLRGVSRVDIYLRHSNFSWATDGPWPEASDFKGYKIGDRFSIENFNSIS